MQPIGIGSDSFPPMINSTSQIHSGLTRSNYTPTPQSHNPLFPCPNQSINYWIAIQIRRNSTMAPLVPIFSAEALPDHVSIVRKNFQERRRKGGPVELEKCKLMEMVQYSCNPPQDGIPAPGVVVCKPVVRLFRRYAWLALFSVLRSLTVVLGVPMG